MNIDLSSRHAVVTGSTAGIGLAIATGLAAAGAHVVVTGRTQARVDEAIATIAAQVPGAKLTGVAGDLGTREGAEKLIAQVADTDILVNNLGIFEPKGFFDIDDDEWQRFFDVNVLSGVRLSRHYAQGMAKRGWGRIQFISSESGVQIPAEMVHYGVTKTAQLGVSRGLAETLAGTGVTVNAILPGPTLSEGVGEFFGKIAAEKGISLEQVEKDFIADHRPTSLIKRLATVDEVASLSVYLASEQASATTGAAVRVDGGVVRSIV
ncbi:NAD(P)-dependent dehydrogenase (short-subunit alcohol dehydrogenase family) [Luteibacter rhizovicinus]|uniref:NAD(P)-dependent dehydrogenase (Short-subunit alcohol dehydrogenase family) n=1 Tax=Luteibacter rhizovicinus TaxID=242606 RepID=A0A4V2W4I9_9GAMM|nr:SDR family oxidoreductase [Luteibacter rhizovicinus]TCV96089.1 NAD(P)-dependent dehydrogenase (short-subunit alcohol dehydrogenase family) [Luteibacter rhizovicinus]